MNTLSPKLQIKYKKKVYSIPLDEIIYIKVKGRDCSFYLQKTSVTNITMTLAEVWEMIEEVGEGYDHKLEKVGRSAIINMGLLIGADSETGYVTLLRGQSPTITPMPESPKHKLSKETKKLVSKIQEIRKQKQELKEDKTECLNHDIYVHVGKPAAIAMQQYLAEKKKQVLGSYVTKARLIVAKETLSGDIHMEAGHQYVDLGLPSGTKWASENLGDYDNHPAFYAWGEFYESVAYDWVHCSTYPKGVRTNQLDASKDIVRKCWGGNWHMPSYQDFQELKDKCTFHWCSDPKGCLVKGPNGNRIFFPALGYKKDAERNETRGLMGKYWTSQGLMEEHAMAFSFKDNDSAKNCIDVSISRMLRCCGLSIRPVLTETTGLAPVKKMVLLIRPFKFTIDSPFSIPHWNPMDWEVLEPQYPIDPAESVKFFVDYCEEHRPDVVVGFCSGTFICKQLKGYPRIFLDPNRLPSEDLKLYREFSKRQKLVTPALIKQFLIAEKNARLLKGEEKCVAVFSRPEKPGEYSSCEQICVEPWDELPFNYRSCLRNWGNTFLYPLIDKM